MTRLRDIQHRVPVSMKDEWYKMDQESINSRIKDGKAYNSIRVIYLVWRKLWLNIYDFRRTPTT